jgi:hypothetical protein
VNMVRSTEAERNSIPRLEVEGSKRVETHDQIVDRRRCGMT